jgi:hypothetical protein
MLVPVDLAGAGDDIMVTAKHTTAIARSLTPATQPRRVSPFRASGRCADELFESNSGLSASAVSPEPQSSSEVTDNGSVVDRYPFRRVSSTITIPHGNQSKIGKHDILFELDVAFSSSVDATFTWMKRSHYS